MPPLQRSALADDPIKQFRDWYERAEGDLPLAHAMTLATVDAEGAPDARMVLLKGFGPEGFQFFTNLLVGEGEAGRGGAEGGAGALLARARPPGAGARARGTDSQTRPRTSTSRPARATRRSARGASPQSEALPDRTTLDARVR